MAGYSNQYFFGNSKRIFSFTFRGRNSEKERVRAVDVLDWEIVEVVHREQSISRAAQVLHMTQPAITYRLNQLEKELNITICVRGKKRIHFTHEGEQLVSFAKTMRGSLNRFIEQLQADKQRVTGELRISVSSHFELYGLPDIVKTFLRQYPNVRIQLHTGWTLDMLDRLIAEEDHIGIIRGDFEWKDAKILLREEHHCIVSREPVDLDRLPELPRVRHETDADVKMILTQWWMERYSQAPNVCVNVDKMESCKEMVLRGIGYSILPGHIFDEAERAEGLHIEKLYRLDGTPVSQKLWAFYREKDLELPQVKAFVRLLQQLFPDEDAAESPPRPI
jgi:DNA-binding transcriptional LysR family regulator